MACSSKCRRRSSRLHKAGNGKRQRDNLDDDYDYGDDDLDEEEEEKIAKPAASTSPEEDARKRFLIEEGLRHKYKVISKKSMDDTDLLVSIHNSIVSHELDAA